MLMRWLTGPLWIRELMGLLVIGGCSAGCGQRAPGDGPVMNDSAVNASVPAASGVERSGAPYWALAPSERVRPYARGLWRLTSPLELGQVLLWPSHILIRYEGVPVLHSYFAHSSGSTEPAAQRTRESALELARGIASRAREQSITFAEAARLYSEDRITRGQGGSLGPVLASALNQWPQVLDAMAALGTGEVSEVVETEFGFHIFTRRAPPPERTLSGSHILIGYAGAPLLGELIARPPLPERSREEALELAERVYREAQAEPERFAELVARYSDHRDAALDGDFGAWSTRELGPYPRTRELLEELPVNGVAGPIETKFGFEIAQRSRERPRLRYAVSLLTLAYAPDVKDAHQANSRPATLGRARELARVLASDPSQFDELVAQHCCAEPVQWTDGQNSSPMALAVRGLRIGSIAPQPLELAYSYVIPKRLDPAQVWKDEAPLQLELPAPQKPDLSAAPTAGR